MTDQARTSVVPEEIASLLERRTTLRGWLAAVEDRREEVREDVFRRVRDDYTERLDGVEASLVTHRSDLAASLEEREAVVAKLDEEREVRAADLEEVELRHAVGEYDEDAWRERKAEHEEVLSELEERLESERAAAEQLRDVLDELGDLGADPETVSEPTAAAGSVETRGGPARSPDTADREDAGSEEPATPRTASGEEPAPGEADDRVGEEPSEVERPGPAADEESDARETEDALDFLENLSLEGVDFDTLDLDAEEGEGRAPGGDAADREEGRG
ncbi:MAG: hypothetical protein ACOC83_00960 [Gemmatimonadota bacterium]